jgi:hypothetical protein
MTAYDYAVSDGQLDLKLNPGLFTPDVSVSATVSAGKMQYYGQMGSDVDTSTSAP